VIFRRDAEARDAAEMASKTLHFANRTE